MPTIQEEIAELVEYINEKESVLADFKRKEERLKYLQSLLDACGDHFSDAVFKHIQRTVIGREKSFILDVKWNVENVLRWIRKSLLGELDPLSGKEDETAVLCYIRLGEVGFTFTAPREGDHTNLLVKAFVRNSETFRFFWLESTKPVGDKEVFGGYVTNYLWNVSLDPANPYERACIVSRIPPEAVTGAVDWMKRDVATTPRVVNDSANLNMELFYAVINALEKANAPVKCVITD